MKHWWLVVVVSSGCLLDGGFSNVIEGTVNPAALCTATASPGGCPQCSTPDGTRCRDQWYSTALRCTGDPQCGASGACRLGFCVSKDADGDGIDDDFEREVAELNFPTVYLAKGESCGGPHGVIYRVRRHPLNPKRLAITYVVLYGRDCGEFNGHTGDAETFAITVDLDVQPGSPATVGVEAWAHAGTTCGSTSSCETAAATGACGEAASTNFPPAIVIYASSDKHAGYLSRDTCANNCLDKCSAGERITGPLINVGEPDHPMVNDLTDQGFIQRADGWADELLHFNPWGTAELGGGGRLDRPLTDLVAPTGR